MTLQPSSRHKVSLSDSLQLVSIDCIQEYEHPLGIISYREERYPTLLIRRFSRTHFNQLKLTLDSAQYPVATNKYRILLNSIKSTERINQVKA